jgi:phenylacetate-CoA ligase
MRGFDPESATVEDLARLPPMSKEEAQREWDAIITVPEIDRARAERILAEQRWFSYTALGHQIFSSGRASGVRGVYVWDWDLLVTLACFAWRMQVREERRSAASPKRTRLVVLAVVEPPHASRPLFDVPTTEGMDTVVVAAGQPFEQIRSAVAEARPTHLVGYASVLARLARASLGESSTSNRVVLERVDEAGNPVPPDEPAAHTLATGLGNRTFPFIRYDLGDDVTMLSGECPCGSSLARVAEVEGRRDDDFRYEGIGVVPASVFRHALGSDPAISEYQVRQTAAGAEVLQWVRPTRKWWETRCANRWPTMA